MQSSRNTEITNKPTIRRWIDNVFSVLFLSTALLVVNTPQAEADQWRAERKVIEKRSVLNSNSRGGCTEYQRRTVTAVYNRYGRALYGGSTGWSTYRRSGSGCIANRNVR